MISKPYYNFLGIFFSAPLAERASMRRFSLFPSSGMINRAEMRCQAEFKTAEGGQVTVEVIKQRLEDDNQLRM
jgi:hypothetical protein